MDPQLKALLDKYSAAGATDDELRHVAATWQAQNGAAASANAPAGNPDDTNVTWRNAMRSLMQGATYNYGDELGLTDASKEATFKKSHPWIDLGLKTLGGAAAPIAAVAAAPEALAGLGGAALLGAGTGGLAASGESNGGLKDRAVAGTLGAAAGGALGAAGYGLSKAAGAGIGAVLDRMNPERPVARALGHLVEPSDIQRMAALNKQAPGTASLATASIPPKIAGVRDVPRLLTMARAMGANPESARTAEQALVGQNKAIDAAKNAIGDKMNALEGRLKLTDELRSALGKTRGVLGGRAPEVPEAPDANPLGLEKSVPFTFDPEQTDMSAAEARAALSELRDIARKGETALALRGNGGVRMYDVKAARNALQKEVYDQIGGFRELDGQYSDMAQQGRNNVRLLNTVADSRRNYGGNEAFKATSGSLGGSLPSGRQGIAMAALDKMLTDKAGAADAVAKYALKPGTDAKVIQQLLKFAKPVSPRVQASVNAGNATAISGLFNFLNQ